MSKTINNAMIRHRSAVCVVGYVDNAVWVVGHWQCCVGGRTVDNSVDNAVWVVGLVDTLCGCRTNLQCCVGGSS